MRFSMILWSHFVHCVRMRISPVAVIPSEQLRWLTCSSRVIIHALRAFAPGYEYLLSKGFLFSPRLPAPPPSGLPRVAPYCVRGGVTVVSISFRQAHTLCGYGEIQRTSEPLVSGNLRTPLLGSPVRITSGGYVTSSSISAVSSASRARKHNPIDP